MRRKCFVVMVGAILITANWPHAVFSAEEPVILKCPEEEIPQMTVTETGKIEVEPDLAVIDLSIQVEEVKIEKAYEKNTEKMNKVFEILKTHGVDSKDIKTTDYQITPMREGKAWFSRVHRPTSYKVTHELTAKMRNLNSVGMILSQTAEIESVNLEQIEYTSSKMEELKKQALKKAVESARETAEILATAAGGKLGRILNIEETPRALPQRHEMMTDSLFQKKFAEALPAAQMGSGTMTVEASCSITYAVETK